MRDEERAHIRRTPSAARLLSIAGVALLILMAVGYALLHVAVSTPVAAGRVSHFLTGFLHQPTTLSRIALRGGTVIIEGLRIENPQGFPQGRLFSSDSIRIAPDWGKLLLGGRSFSLVRLEGLTVNLSRDSAGTWNFSPLTGRFAGAKGGAETFIKRLELERAAVKVNGRGVQGLSLSINDLSTKGTTGSRLVLTGRFGGSDRFRIEGEGRLGADPSFDLSLDAPLLSLGTLPGGDLPFDLAKGKGKLLLTARLRGGELAVEGKAGCEGISLVTRDDRLPLRATLETSVRYNTRSDAASVDRCSLRINEMINLRAVAKVHGLKKEKAFTADVSGDELDLTRLFAFLPPKMRHDVSPRGTIAFRQLHLAGDGRNGITSGSGGLSLRGVGVAKGKSPLIAGLAAEVSLGMKSGGWDLTGHLMSAGEGDVPLQRLKADVSARFSRRFRLLSVHIPSLSATVSGAPVTGAFTYQPSAATPFAAALSVARAPLSFLNHFLAGKQFVVSSGTAELSLQATGQGPKEFQGNLSARIMGLEATARGKRVELRSAATQATVKGSSGTVSVAGKVGAEKGRVNDRLMDVSFDYTVSGRTFLLSEGAVHLERADVDFAEIKGAIPRREAYGKGLAIPLSLEFSGISFRGKGGEASGVAGALRATLVQTGERRWLVGVGDAAVRDLAYKGNGLGAVAGRFSFAERGTTAEIGGKILGGTLAATASFDPFSREMEPRFSVRLTGVQGARLAPLLPGARTMKITDGILDSLLAGTYSPKGGLRCRFSANGKTIALTGKGGKTLLADGGLVLVGEAADGTLRINEGTVSAGTALALKLGGEVARVFAPDREGEISFSATPAPLAALFDIFVNLLPRSLQEANVAGSLGAMGTARIKGKKLLLDGRLQFTDALLDIPAQKMSVTGIKGAIPFSLDVSGASPAAVVDMPRLNKVTYAELLNNFREAAKTGRTISIGKIRFGALEFGETAMVIRAHNGLTEMVAFESALSQGVLFGKGFLLFRNGVQYGSDFIINDLSLREFCNAYPAIKGYISGRVDGILRLRGEGKGLDGLIGYVDLWARKGPGEEMLVSKEFLQKIAGKKLKGIFFRSDRPYDRAEISAYLDGGYLTFDVLDISHANIFGMKDLSVSVAPVQNRISVEHLITVMKEAAARGKGVRGESPTEAPPATEFKWQE